EALIDEHVVRRLWQLEARRLCHQHQATQGDRWPTATSTPADVREELVDLRDAAKFRAAKRRAHHRVCSGAWITRVDERGACQRSLVAPNDRATSATSATSAVRAVRGDQLDQGIQAGDLRSFQAAVDEETPRKVFHQAQPYAG